MRVGEGRQITMCDEAVHFSLFIPDQIHSHLKKKKKKFKIF